MRSNAEPVQVRSLVTGDASPYYVLRAASDREYPQFVGFNVERELSAGIDGIGRLLEQYPSEGTIVWGALAHDALVGVTALSRRLSPKFRHKAFLWGMYVSPFWRNGVIARALMETAIAWARTQADVLAICLQVTADNQRGRRFYERFGFTAFGLERNALRTPEAFHDVYLLEREL